MTQHPRTPGTFWDAIGWRDQIDENTPLYNHGNKLAAIRQRMGWTQQQLADHLGLVSDVSVAHWENHLEPIPRKYVPAIERLTGEAFVDPSSRLTGWKAA